MDIVPKYDLIAVAKTGTDEKKVTLKSAQDAKVGSTEVKVTLPDAFKGKKVYINHNNGANLYVATANATTGEITFTTNGFSPFTFALSNPNVVAEVNGNAYTSFADAVSAVPANGTIEITGGTSPYTGTANKTFTVKNSTSADITVNGQPIEPTKSYTFKYTHSSGGSSGGSSSGKTTYKVTTSAVNNGGVNASPSNAEKGATITITLSPDKGYKLDKLTVTDGSGKTVSTVKKSDTVYTFTMPASAVKVGVSYVKATETPSETKFNDVSANDWFASAVDYVTGKGMMNGTADNTFSPKANTTRGMVVTVLYRLENQPSTSAASFTDVASGAYYANAVAWANANGIVSGYGSGKFGPNDKVTREQLAAILYRYAQYKKYDVSGANSLDGYTDVQSVSSYAVPALQWANAAGVVTGKSGSKLDPKGNATRAEVAAMLMRFCENVK
ncbi:S-layer homology domain-containing protein [Agathobaculum butyriciproducens]|nr:S-layer homology domain-containing protein [Agathobaculum butyriciproducens]RGC59061.1 S-layer homology domain-containing protein [Agathobaculum butyriciproducens]